MRRRLQTGQALVEASLVTVLFVVILFGLIDFARIVWSYTMIANAAREATRFAMVHGSASGNAASVTQIQGIVISRSPGILPAMLTTTVSFSPDQSPGSTVTVAVTYKVYPIAPYIPVGPLNVTSNSQRIIYQ